MSDTNHVYCDECGFPHDEHSGPCVIAPEPMEQSLWLSCCACRRNLVNVLDGFDTCANCERDA